MHFVSSGRGKLAALSNTIGTRWRLRQLFVGLTLLSLLALTACGGLSTGSAPSATPAPERVNGFGTRLNHVHALLALPGNVLVLATHYGLFRSPDAGKNWTLVAAGPNQLMDGLMTTSLVVSSLDPQRLFVLTQPALNDHKGTLGLYTSADQGRTWKLAIPNSQIGDMYFAQPGNDNAEEVYTYIRKLGAQGLKVSRDAGEHFSTTGTLPFPDILGMLALPGAPGQLLVYGNEGVARSMDSGAHWQNVSGVQGAVFGMTTSGTHSPVYATGDAGTYASADGGKSFTLVQQQAAYAALTASPVQSKELYGKTGTAIYHSTDGGHSWQPLPHIKGNLQSLAADPANGAVLYLALSYPTEMYRFDQNSAQWISLTPQS